MGARVQFPRQRAVPRLSRPSAVVCPAGRAKASSRAATIPPAPLMWQTVPVQTTQLWAPLGCREKK